MPLIQGKSNKAFQHNLKTEMHEGKPQKQALAISYSIKRKNARKKMAEGGEINESAVSEHRPMPEERDKDASMIARNSAKKALVDSGWTDQPTVRQAQSKPKVQPLKHPSMVPSNAFSTKLYDREGRLTESASPGPYDAQPEAWEDEEDAKKMGSDPDMAPEHSTGKKPYAKGGKIEASDKESHNIHMRTEMEPMDSGEEEKEREDEADLMEGASPSMDEGSEMASELEEEGPDRSGPAVPDMEHQHNNGRAPYAEGGSVEHEFDEQPEEEAEDEHYHSVTAAIMAKRKMRKEDGMSGSEDMDSAMNYADGGEVESGSPDMDRAARMAEGGEVEYPYEEGSDMSYTNNEEHPNFYYPQNEDYVLKENYNEPFMRMQQPEDSNERGDERERAEEDKHDMIGKIRSKMAKRQFKTP